MTNGMQEWLIYQKWKDEFLPKLFPETTFTVKRHPAAFTAKEEVEAISMETGIPIPQKYQSLISEETGQLSD